MKIKSFIDLFLILFCCYYFIIFYFILFYFVQNLNASSNVSRPCAYIPLFALVGCMPSDFSFSSLEDIVDRVKGWMSNRGNYHIVGTGRGPDTAIDDDDFDLDGGQFDQSAQLMRDSDRK